MFKKAVRQSFIPAVALVAAVISAPLGAAPLTSLTGGGSLTIDDVIFDNFVLTDNSDTFTFPDDTEVTESMFDVSVSSTASTVTLVTTIDPAISLVDDTGFVDFFLDFEFSLDGGSTRQLTGVSLGGGDLSASGGNAQNEIGVEYALGGFSSLLPVLEIYEDTLFGSQTSDDTGSVGPFSSLLMEGKVDGATAEPGATAGLSTFALTFQLDSNFTPPTNPPTNPPGTAVPVPASLVLLLGGVAGLGLMRRRRT